MTNPNESFSSEDLLKAAYTVIQSHEGPTEYLQDLPMSAKRRAWLEEGIGALSALSISVKLDAHTWAHVVGAVKIYTELLALTDGPAEKNQAIELLRAAARTIDDTIDPIASPVLRQLSRKLDLSKND